MSKTWKDGRKFMVLPAEYCPEENVTMPPAPLDEQMENEGRVLVPAFFRPKRMDAYVRNSRRDWRDGVWQDIDKEVPIHIQ